jgi:hypothetical protein
VTFRRPLRRILVLALAAVAPLLLFLNVLQGVRYTRLVQEVGRLEQEQVDWFEKNKALLAAIAIYSSPQRIESLLGEESSARPPRSGETVRVRVESSPAGAETAQ